MDTVREQASRLEKQRSRKQQGNPAVPPLPPRQANTSDWDWTVVSLAIDSGRFYRRGCGGRDQAAQHVRQDSAVLVVVDFDRGVDSRLHLDLLLRAVGAPDREPERLL